MPTFHFQEPFELRAAVLALLSTTRSAKRDAAARPPVESARCPVCEDRAPCPRLMAARRPAAPMCTEAEPQ